MISLQELSHVEMVATLVVGPVAGLLFVRITWEVVSRFVSNYAAMLIFKNRGFHVHKQVIINREPAIITKMGAWSTHFEIEKENGHAEFLTVTNTRLDVMEIRISLNKRNVIEGAP